MEFLVLVALVIPIGSLLGVIAFFKVKQLRYDVDALKRQLARSKASQSFTTSPKVKTTAVPERPKPSEESATDAKSPESDWQQQEQPKQQEQVPEKPQSDWDQPVPSKQPASLSAKEAIKKPSIDNLANDNVSRWIEALKANWMTWLGGLSIALSGIFLARYSIEQGLVGPTTRITMGILMGIALHVGAEYLRRRTGEANQIFAMLAASGSVTLFATLLAALHYYQMFSVTFVFIALSVVALFTVWLALIYGPSIAAIGMIGAYILPIMVSSGEGRIIVALTYSLIISASILLLIRYVYRYWLFLGVVAGAMLWWFISLFNSDADLWRGLYLAVFVYSMIAIIDFNWLLNKTEKNNKQPSVLKALLNFSTDLDYLKLIALLLIIVAQAVSLLALYPSIPPMMTWLPLSLLILHIAKQNRQFTALPWFAFISLASALIIPYFTDRAYHRISLEAVSLEAVSDLFIMLATLAAIYIAYAVRSFSGSNNKHWWASVGCLAPLMSFTLSYLLSGSFAEDLQWSMYALFVAAGYMFLATYAVKSWHKIWAVWLFIAAHFAYTFAAVLFVEDAGLTLAIAIQVISVAWIIKRFNVTELNWLIKAIVVVTVIRLSLNPWLFEYPIESHWSLLTYGGSTLSCFIAGFLLKDFDKTIARWCHVATLHLFILTAWVELRYFLYDGNIFKSDFTFTEAAINISFFGIMSMLYQYKKHNSHYLSKFYDWYSKALLILSGLNYLIVLGNTLESNYWAWNGVGTTPIFNILLLAFGMPMVICLLGYLLFSEQFQRYFRFIAVAAGFVFINIEIRHIWQGTTNLHTATSDGELYTYSAVWLVTSILGLVLASMKNNVRLYQAGMALLVLTIVKVFFIDMSQLEGVYRILVFMGLGLSLLGIAYLHKKLAITEQ